MGRGRTGHRAGGRRPAARERASSQDLHASDTGTGLAPAPSLGSATLPRVWQGIGYRPLTDPAPARPLFDFAAVPWPGSTDIAFAWGALAAQVGGERLVGALVAEQSHTSVLLHGPVVLTEMVHARGDSPTAGRPPAGSPAGQSSAPTANPGKPADPLEVAAQLVAAALDHATALGGVTVFARPQGLDRVWVRFGFVPVPEVTLPPTLAGRTGAGLYAWRGGSALWTLREAADA